MSDLSTILSTSPWLNFVSVLGELYCQERRSFAKSSKWIGKNYRLRWDPEVLPRCNAGGSVLYKGDATLKLLLGGHQSIEWDLEDLKTELD